MLNTVPGVGYDILFLSIFPLPGFRHKRKVEFYGFSFYYSFLYCPFGYYRSMVLDMKSIV